MQRHFVCMLVRTVVVEETIPKEFRIPSTQGVHLIELTDRVERLDQGGSFVQYVGFDSLLVSGDVSLPRWYRSRLISGGAHLRTSAN